MGWRWELGNFKGKSNSENKWDGGGNLKGKSNSENK